MQYIGLKRHNEPYNTLDLQMKYVEASVVTDRHTDTYTHRTTTVTLAHAPRVH